MPDGKPAETAAEWAKRKHNERLEYMSPERRAAHDRNVAALSAAFAMPHGPARDAALEAAANVVNAAMADKCG